MTPDCDTCQDRGLVKIGPEVDDCPDCTCPDCGGHLEPTVWETRDPADDRMRCEDCGEVTW